MTCRTLFGFADEMRVGLRGMVRRVWGRRGVKVLQSQQIAYEWSYLFLVVDGLSGKLSWTWIESMRGDALAPAVRALKQQTELAAVVWDGARGHRHHLVRAAGLALIEQPPYSPELNPAERVFEEIRRWTEGKAYGDIAEKVAAVDAFLSELEAEPQRVRSLTGWDWIVDSAQRLPAQYAA